MSEKSSGSYTLTIDESEEVPCSWTGVLTFPDDNSESVKFQLYSYNELYSTKPFRMIGDHSKYVVHGWLNSCRPVTLLEPFSNSTGGGQLAQGYRVSARQSGSVSDLIENEHIDGDDKEAIFKIGFWSETLTLIGEQQSKNEGATKPQGYPFETSMLESSRTLQGLGNLEFKISYRTDEFSREIVARAHTRLVCPSGIDVWVARRWARFHLAFVDFLGGCAAGEFKVSVRAKREIDSPMRMGVHARKKSDYLHDICIKVGEPIDVIPELMERAWKNEDIKRRIFVVTTLLSANLGVIERFSRTIGYIEKWLRQRYSEKDHKAKRQKYTNGIRSYNDFMKNAPESVQDFAEEFASPRYPKELSLKDLLVLAFEECGPLGLDRDETHAKQIARLRNQISHGDEQSEAAWVRSLLISSDVGLAIIELLTAKDLGLNPPMEFKPRIDRLGYQEGIYKSQRSGL